MGKTQDSAGKDGKTVVFGSFKAMGDLLCASPVVRSELEAGNRIHLLLFDNKALAEFARLIDFGRNQDRLAIHFLPVPGGLRAFRRFFRKMSKLDPDLVWVSPHAPAPASSWKVPTLMWLLKKLYWKQSRLAGADSERMSFLFDDRIPVDRGLPFIDREWNCFRALRSDTMGPAPCAVSFLPRISDARKMKPAYDLLIHPGANAENRRWPAGHYGEVVRGLPMDCRIAVVGLPGDIDAMKASLPTDRGIAFLTGSLEDSLLAIARSRVLLTMDSGNVHFAHVLGVPAVALFGKSDPVNVVPLNGCVTPLYQKRFPCQPCGKTYCTQPQVYCMNSIAPETVLIELRRCLGADQVFEINL